MKRLSIVLGSIFTAVHAIPYKPPHREPAQNEELLLVFDVLRKERKATAEFVALCTDCVYPFVRRRLLPRVEAIDDVMQEIVLSAWQNLGNFRGDSGLRPWFLGIARHKVDDYYRKWIHAAEDQQDQESIPELPVAPIVEDKLSSVDQERQVRRTLSLLPEAYAFVLLWRYRDELSVREIAESSGKTEKAVERMLARARENFRKRWNDAHAGH